MNTVLKWTLQKHSGVTVSVQKLTPFPGPDATLLWVHGCKPALVSCSSKAVSVVRNILYNQYMGSMWEPGCVCFLLPPAERWPEWPWVLQRNMQWWGHKPQALGNCCRPNAFLFTSVQHRWVYLPLLSLLQTPADWLLNSRLLNLSFLCCLFQSELLSFPSFFSMAYLLDPYFPFGVPVPTTPVDDFTVIAAQVGCFLWSVAMLVLTNSRCLPPPHLPQVLSTPLSLWLTVCNQCIKIIFS